MTNHAPAPWRPGRHGSVVCDQEYDGAPNGYDAHQYYGGYLIAESIAERNIPVIAAAPALLAANKAAFNALTQALALLVDAGTYNRADKIHEFNPETYREIENQIRTARNALNLP